MTKQIYKILVLVTVLLLKAVEAKSWLSCFHCPTSEDYSFECRHGVIPRWPLCLMYTVDDWVDMAIDSSTRCCGDDRTDCKCPKKDTWRFKKRIGDYCEAAKQCEEDRKMFSPYVNTQEGEEMLQED